MMLVEPVLRPLLGIALFVLVPLVSAEGVRPQPGDMTIDTEPFSPCAGRDFPTQLLFGDTHLHTAVSVDAGTMNTVGQEEAFRFARGEEIITTHGLRVRLSRPLDFLVVSDHAEMYGLMTRLLRGDPAVLNTDAGRRWYESLTAGDPDLAFRTAMEIVDSLSKKEAPIANDQLVRDAWRKYTALADRYNQPGRFTAIIGYEYTTQGGCNLHRNVLFRGSADEANQTRPFSRYDSQNPEDLWRHLDEFQNRTGAQVLAIPHNGNLSNGRMFSVETFDGRRYTRELAELRAGLEPLY